MTVNVKQVIVFLLFSFMTILCTNVFAQSGFYIPKQAKIYFAGDSATIFTNVLNDGNLGLGQKAFLNFKGRLWQNHPLSMITDETSGISGTGGWVRFLSDSIRQQIIGGYNSVTKTGPAFQHLMIQNPIGVELAGGSTKVRKEFSFNRGLVYLNGKIFVVGDNNPGNITGFNETKYFVTGTQPRGSLLLRENINQSNGKIIFPVGTKENAYTPAAVQSKSAQGDDYFVNVFDEVRSNLFIGTTMTKEGVAKTWNIGKLNRPYEDEVEVFLQHLNNDEGSIFKQNKAYSYISNFVSNQWDTAYPQQYPSAGNLTTGNTLSNSGVNSRTLRGTLSNDAYFTKFTGFGDSTLTTKILFGAYRIDNKLARVVWQTKPEVNIKTYIVQRRYASEPDFTNIDTVSSQAVNGLSLYYLNYAINDPNTYKGITYYRLQIFDYSNRFQYSTVASINLSTFNYIVLWPNPSHGEFNIIINTHLAKTIVITNNLGQKMWEGPIPIQRILRLRLPQLVPGTYYISAIDPDGVLVETQKLLIVK